MDIRLIFLNYELYALSDAFASLHGVMDTHNAGEWVTRKGKVISSLYPYRKPTQVGESSRLR